MKRPLVKFAPSSELYRELKQEVADYFAITGFPVRDTARLLGKTAIIALWCAIAYYLLVFQSSSCWQAVLLSLLLGLGLAGFAFNTTHDAGHGAYSERRTVNRAMAWTLDLMGASSYVWVWKHNVLHHTFTNVAGLDDDIELGPLGNLRPDVPLAGIHRFQHVYLWFLYAWLALKWQLFDDFRDVVRGRIGRCPIRRPLGFDLAAFVMGKTVFLCWAVLIPALYRPFLESSDLLLLDRLCAGSGYERSIPAFTLRRTGGFFQDLFRQDLSANRLGLPSASHYR